MRSEAPNAARGRGIGGVSTSPAQLEGLGERRKLSQPPAEKRVLVHFELFKKTHVHVDQQI